ncbi:ATP-binding protein [Neorhizobium sp. NCHU2750]|uniref:ATP-binding protein n=1 Tax=Neorhizobium sp. NCHU2750 TaxID=1825976 RepID=UPI000E72CF18|nr:histidine kinase [Neorhizobium sp. NCHU2750]
MKRWYRSLVGQLIVSLILTVFVSQVLAFGLIWHDRIKSYKENAESDFFNRTKILSKLLVTVPPELRDGVAAAGAGERTRFWISEHSPIEDTQWSSKLVKAASQTLSNSGPMHDTAYQMVAKANLDWHSRNGDLPLSAAVVMRTDFPQDSGVGVSVRISNAAWLNAVYFSPLGNPVFSLQLPVTIGIASALVVVMGIVIALRIARPLRHLASAADAIGRGDFSTDLPRSRSDEIQRLTSAFDNMRTRLQRFIDDRTLLVAAVGHDLRTPLTALKLRAEQIEDEALQQKMIYTIDEMRDITDAVLTLSREGADGEPTRAVDLASLIASLCDDLSDIGLSVNFEDAPRIDYSCRPAALRRAIRNLIENAVRYAGHAEVSLACGGGEILIMVRDEGPGIDPSKLSDVFIPFFRIEASRSRQTGGAGLGLSIARMIIRQHGGDIKLTNTASGLEAAVHLPGDIRDCDVHAGNTALAKPV